MTKTDSDEDEDAIETNKPYHFALISSDSEPDEEDKEKCLDVHKVLMIMFIKENIFRVEITRLGIRISQNFCSRLLSFFVRSA